MARSRRRTPKLPVTTAESDKWHKVTSHRAERAAARNAMAAGSDTPHPKRFGDPWKGEKDGKLYHAEPKPGWTRK